MHANVTVIPRHLALIVGADNKYLVARQSAEDGLDKAKFIGGADGCYAGCGRYIEAS
jgi:hypothetical protein